LLGRSAAATIAAAIAIVGVAGAIAEPSVAQADGQLNFRPTVGLPASDVAIIGASPSEAPGATWAQGRLGGIPAQVNGQALLNTQTLLHYTTATGTWQAVPLDDTQGQELNFTWWASEVTADGGVVLAGEGSGQLGLVVRNPGGAFALAPPPTSNGKGATLTPGEQPFTGAPVMAALDETGGSTGVLIAPVQTSAPAITSTKSGTGEQAAEAEAEASTGPGVLHYDGNSWTREPICEQYASSECTAPAESVTPLAISASSPHNAWMLVSTSADRAMLFQRLLEPDDRYAWVRRRPSSWLLGSESPPLGEERTAPVSSGALLTAVGQGVWVDLKLQTGNGAGSATVLVSPSASGEVAGTWCYPTSLCPGDPSLGAALPRDYGSFAWPGSGAGGDLGTRVISGLAEGALLTLGEGQSEFAYTVGGGAGGAGEAIGAGGITLGEVPGTGSTPSGGAAFASPSEGWLGAGSAPAAIQVAPSPATSQLDAWPVPFRRPLLAVVGEPGSTPGEGSAQALAVGADGEVARYLPGEGWTPEYLYNSSGERQTPNLRGVAWPEPGRAYAVGDEGAMWLWQSSTGLWEPDPAEPLGLDAQLTAIAFSSSDPSTGYAVGKQGVLLSYDKTWRQEAPPAGLSRANFTSVAFAGDEAIATYRMLDPSETGGEIGGLIVNSGSGWQLDPSAQALLGESGPVLSKVAGLPDGGAVAAGPGVVIERDSATSAWRFSDEPLPEAQNISALAAFREGSAVRALVSLDTSDNPNGSPIYEAIDDPPGAALGPYEVLLGPDPLPEHGYLLRETAGGWQDEEHGAYPTSDGGDLPGWPDAVLALLLDPSGEQGWAVGGQTGVLYGTARIQTEEQTAGVMRFGPGPQPPEGTEAAIPTPANQATFAVAGGAQCLSSGCANLANENLGPDAWLSGAIARAGQISELHAFLYTGGRLASAGSASSLELSRYANLLRSSGDLPVYAAISPSDVLSPGETGPFTEALGSMAPAGSVPFGTPPPPASTAAYAFDSAGAGGTVRVIVLDDSQPTPPTEAAGPSCPSELSAPYDQLQWLCAQLYYAKQAGVPAIVMGNAALGNAAYSQVLLSQGASAYLYDDPEGNASGTIGTGAGAIPAYGSGTLGYSGGPSGFLLVSVDVAQRNTSTGVAPVTASLIPNVGQLGLNAVDGTLLRRSQVALFEGLARRPLGGEGRTGSGETTAETPDPYTPIPQACAGPPCIPMSASFTSSNPTIGTFVEQDPSSPNARAPLQVNGKPVPDSASGLFCAFNAGTTTVTITAGGLSYSEPVTVQAGSVEEPCGTVPVPSTPAVEESRSEPTVAPPPPLGPLPAATQPPISLAAPPLPAAPAPVVHPPSAHPLPLLFASIPPLAPVRVALPPPVPQAARPAPPSGTAGASQPVEAVEDEREQQEAVDLVHNAAAYRTGGNALPPWSPIVLVVIAAGAGAGLTRRRPKRAPALARSVSADPRDRS
jgi:hypothetical protein